jgi:hypothetical protein
MTGRLAAEDVGFDPETAPYTKLFTGESFLTRGKGQTN